MDNFKFCQISWQNFDSKFDSQCSLGTLGRQLKGVNLRNMNLKLFGVKFPSRIVASRAVAGCQKFANRLHGVGYTEESCYSIFCLFCLLPCVGYTRGGTSPWCKLFWGILSHNFLPPPLCRLHQGRHFSLV